MSSNPGGEVPQKFWWRPYLQTSPRRHQTLGHHVCRDNLQEWVSLEISFLQILFLVQMGEEALIDVFPVLAESKSVE